MIYLSPITKNLAAENSSINIISSIFTNSSNLLKENK